MRELLQFYIDGRWVDPATSKTLDVINPATEQRSGGIAVASAADVDGAVSAARRAFASWSQSSREDRLALLERILSEYQKRVADLAAAITEEMGAPRALASGFQVGLGAGHLSAALEALKAFRFEEQRGATLITREPIGVCALITPWNWPMNQIAIKVFPALAVGCTMVLKPSELAPYSGQIFAEILHSARVPAGVFNLIQGDGAGTGAALAGHPDVDLISFTGSTRAGIEIGRAAAADIKRVCQELGGKGPNIILDDPGFANHVAAGVNAMMGNSGQTCSAPSRMLVPRSRMTEAIRIAAAAANKVTVGDPNGDFAIGPVVSLNQYNKIQTLIQRGIDEGATLAAGGLGRPEGIRQGYYVRPTVFGDVSNDMTIAREEIFGPVLTILAYDTLAQAVEIANDTEYGLASYVAGADLDQARAVARQIRSGWVVINDGFDFNAPFGGFKKSGNGREWGEFGFHEYLETKAMLGYA